MPGSRRWALGVLLVATAVVVRAAPSPAHSSLTGAEPGPGERVTEPVATVTLVFDTELENAAVVLESPDGTRIAGTLERVDGVTVSYQVPGLEQEGEYVVRYTVLSEDGDETSAGYAFSYAAGRSSNALIWLGLVVALLAASAAMGLGMRRSISR